MTVALALADEIRRYGASVRDFFGAAGERRALYSPLFNVPLRLVVGSHCYAEHLPWLLREIAATAAPEELGARMKGLAVRPNYVTLNALMLGYFTGREQRRLLRGLGEDDVDPRERRADHETVVGFWRRVAGTYLEGERILPAETGYRLPVLPPDQVAELAGRLRDDHPERRRRVRRTLSVGELYTFILNGEARVGVFHHGPYPLPGGDLLVIKELVGLQDDFLPWRLQERPPVDALARAMRVRDVAVKIDLFGSLVADPLEYEDRVVAHAVLARDGEDLREADDRELAEVERTAGDAQLAMYEQAAAWSPEYQVAYGADLYAALVLSFARLAGLDLADRVRDAFRATAARVVPGLLSGDEPPLVLGRLGAADGELYAPAVPEEDP
jgi:hypothetical protein